MLNLDTHILVHALSGSLTPAEEALLAADQWSVCPMVFWEMAKLNQAGRIIEDLYAPSLVADLSRIHVWPLTLEVCRTSVRLDFRSDPADELIAATSIVHNVPLITRDRKLLASQMIPLAR